MDSSTNFQRFEIPTSAAIESVYVSSGGNYLITKNVDDKFRIYEFQGCDSNCTTCSGPTEYQCDICKSERNFK